MKKLLTILVLLMIVIPSSNAQVNPVRNLDYYDRRGDTIVLRNDTIYSLLLVCDTSSTYYTNNQMNRLYSKNDSVFYTTYLTVDTMKVYNNPNLFWEYGYCVFNYSQWNYNFEPVYYLNEDKKLYGKNYIIWKYIMFY